MFVIHLAGRPAVVMCHKLKVRRYHHGMHACMQVMHYTVDKHISERSAGDHVMLWQVFSEQHLSERFNLVLHVF